MVFCSVLFDWIGRAFFKIFHFKKSPFLVPSVQKWLIVFKNLLIMLEILTGDVRKTTTRSCSAACSSDCLLFCQIYPGTVSSVAALVTLALMEGVCPGYPGTSTVTTQPMAGKS